MRTIELDPKVWGRGVMVGSLLRPGRIRQQCCLGIACSVYGISDRRIRGVLDLIDVKNLPKPLQLPRPIASKLQNLNDDGAITDDEERVYRLNGVLERAQASFRFELKQTRRAASTAKRAVTSAASEAQS